MLNAVWALRWITHLWWCPFCSVIGAECPPCSDRCSDVCGGNGDGYCSEDKWFCRVTRQWIQLGGCSASVGYWGKAQTMQRPCKTKKNKIIIILFCQAVDYKGNTNTWVLQSQTLFSLTFKNALTLFYTLICVLILVKSEAKWTHGWSSEWHISSHHRGSTSRTFCEYYYYSPWQALGSIVSFKKYNSLLICYFFLFF